MCEVVPHIFHQFFQNARRSRGRVGALAWVRVGVRVGVRVTVGRRPLAIFDRKKKTQKHKKQLENLYKVKYIWYFIWYDLLYKAGEGASNTVFPQA